MHFHLPKPLHGWREFVGEVGIIVVGVLIALAAEQVVEQLSWDKKVGLGRVAMRIELAQDDGPQAYARLLIGRCLDSEIERIHDSAVIGSPEQLRKWAAAYAPPARVWDSEAWNIVMFRHRQPHGFRPATTPGRNPIASSRCSPLRIPRRADW